MTRSQLISFASRHIDLLGFALCVAFFLIFPSFDLWLASQFYDKNFYYDQFPVIRVIYLLFADIHLLFLCTLIVASIYFCAKNQTVKKQTSIYLLSCLLLGPGLLVNIIAKDNSFGRPRPVHLDEFGGDKHYAPVFHYSGECQKNCSFVSGHASVGFYVMALFWVTRQRKWLITGVALGSIVGYARITQGGHFLSDVVFAGWIVYFNCSLLAKWFNFKFSQKRVIAIL